MDRDEILKEREIGKQLLLVNILQTENEKVRRGGFSTITADRIAKWADISIEDVRRMVDACGLLDITSIASKAVNEYFDSDGHSEERYMRDFALFTCYRNGTRFIKSFDENSFEVKAEINFDLYMEAFKNEPVSDAAASTTVFKQLMMLYAKCFVSAVEEVMALGYAWEVIQTMIGFEMSKDRFEDLKEMTKSDISR
ncbi:hypothetical protein SAMN02910339_01339 [Lachnospiraceae bacterium YSD2013]|nr:hypothetical protein SAMN02910339_01339 [Lachnospiraceae bacterium YSD2013]